MFKVRRSEFEVRLACAEERIFQVTRRSFKHGKDAFHRVRESLNPFWDGVESVPTRERPFLRGRREGSRQASVKSGPRQDEQDLQDGGLAYQAVEP